jgi:PleD family two-component response regulator
MYSPTILVVDDSPFAAKALVRVLELRGLRARAATTMDEAMHVCAEARPAVLVADTGMPHLDVVELCRRVRNAARGQRLSVLLISTQREEQVSEVLVTVAPDAFMEKREGAAAVAARVEDLCTAVGKPSPFRAGVPVGRA